MMIIVLVVVVVLLIMILVIIIIVVIVIIIVIIIIIIIIMITASRSSLGLQERRPRWIELALGLCLTLCSPGIVYIIIVSFRRGYFPEC